MWNASIMRQLESMEFMSKRLLEDFVGLDKATTLKRLPEVWMGAQVGDGGAFVAARNDTIPDFGFHLLLDEQQANVTGIMVCGFGVLAGLWVFNSGWDFKSRLRMVDGKPPRKEAVQAAKVLQRNFGIVQQT